MPRSPRSAEIIPITAKTRQLVDASARIRMEPIPELDELTYLARHFVQATLPHRSPKGAPPVWQRRNGNLTLQVQPFFDPQTLKPLYPYGSIPRLVLYWLTAHIVATRGRERDICLGGTLSGFLRDLGLNPDTGGGRNSDRARLKEQLSRLLKARISFLYEGARHESFENLQVANKAQLWWDPVNPDQLALFDSYIRLDADFVQMVHENAIPLDQRAISALKSSSLALDLYALSAYLTFRARKAGKPLSVTWKQLHQQVGAGYGSPKDFRRFALEAFQQVKSVYPGLSFDTPRGRLVFSEFGELAVPPRLHSIVLPSK